MIEYVFTNFGLLFYLIYLNLFIIYLGSLIFVGLPSWPFYTSYGLLFHRVSFIFLFWLVNTIIYIFLDLHNNNDFESYYLFRLHNIFVLYVIIFSAVDYIDYFFKTKISVKLEFIDNRINYLWECFYYVRLIKYYFLPIKELLLQRKQIQGQIYFDDHLEATYSFTGDNHQLIEQFIKKSCKNKTKLWSDTFNVFRYRHNYINYLLLSVLSTLLLKVYSSFIS